MYNEFFESIIRTSGDNTDYLDDFDDRTDNFWAPVPVIEQMFEQVLKEAGQKPNRFGVYVNDKLINNGGPTTSAEKNYRRYKRAPAHGSKNPKMSRSNSKTDDPDMREKDDQDILYNSVKKFDYAEIEKSEEIYMKNIFERMKKSLDPGTLIAFFKQKNPEILDKISNHLINIVKRNRKSIK